MYLLLKKAKDFFIFLLILLAVYQTFNLWFEDISNHRFFYNSKSWENKGSNIKVENNLKSIIINLGNNKFIQSFDTSSEAVYKNYFDNTISFGLKKGKFTESKLNMNVALDNKGIIYNYNYQISGQDIKTIFKVSNKNTFKINKFDTIGIIPNLRELDTISIIFFDTEELKQYEFLFKKSNNYDISSIINKFYLNTSEIYYLSSLKSGFNLFESNQFIATWEKEALSYNKISAKNPVIENGKTSLRLLENYVNHFFQNPAIKWWSTSNGAVTYSDESTVVKYSNGVLEYSDYKISNSENNKNVFNLYNIATNFLKNDIELKNDYYLKNYEVGKNEVKFYFDYKINNLPIRLYNENNKSEMKSMLEVTVSQNKVTKYKKYVYDFYKEERVTFNKDFLTSVDNILYKNNSNDKIKSIELGYKFDPENTKEDLKIGWFVNIKDKLFFEG